MKKIKNCIILLAGVSVLASCSVAAPWGVTTNQVGPKRGVAERKIWFNITLGHTDLGIATAAKNGGITKVATVDRKIKGGLFSRTLTTIVTGE